MILEIDVAINFLLSYCYSKLDREKADSFKRDLSRILTNAFTGHWHPNNPQLGSAFRALLVTPEVVDPAIAAAADASQISLATIRDQLPEFLTIWVDPCEVSYRVGDRGEITSLWQEKQQQHLQLRPKEHKCNRKQHKKNNKSLVRWNGSGSNNNNNNNNNNNSTISSSSSSSSSGTASPQKQVPNQQCSSPSLSSACSSAMSSTTSSPAVSAPPSGSPSPPPPTYRSSPMLTTIRPSAVPSPPLTPRTALSRCALQNSSWRSLASYSSGSSSGIDSTGEDLPSPPLSSWSTSTWENCGSSVASDDSGVGVSPAASPTMSQQDCVTSVGSCHQHMYSDASAWMSFIGSQLSGGEPSASPAFLSSEPAVKMMSLSAAASRQMYFCPSAATH